MKDFNGKIIKVYLNATSGWLTVTGPFIKYDDDFLVVQNAFNHNIQYLSKYYIRSIEIVKDIEEDE